MSTLHNPRAIIAALMITIIIDIMGVGLVFPILPSLFMSEHSALLPYAMSEHLRYFLYGLGMAVWPLGMIFGTPYLGELSDIYGRKKIILLALLGTGAAYVVSAVAIGWHSYALFLISRLLSGLFASSFPIAQAVIADISPFDQKARNLGWVNLAASVGFIIGPLISSVSTGNNLGIHFAITTPFWIAAGLAMINAGLLIRLLPETFVPNLSKQIRLTEIFSACRFIFTDRRTRYYAFLFLLFQLAWGFFGQGIALVLDQRFNFSVQQIGIYYMAMGASFAISQLFIQPWAVRRFKLKPLFTYSVLALGILFALMASVNVLALQWLFTIIAAPANLLAYCALLAALSNSVNADEQGQVMGGSGSVFGISWFVNALLLGSITSFYVMLPIILACGFAMLSFVFSFKIREQ